MGIWVDQKALVFHLQSAHTSYIFQVMENGELGQLYYGKKIAVDSNYQDLIIRDHRSSTPTWKTNTPNFQLDVLKQEYASFGSGDFRFPAFQIQQQDGSRISEFKYQSYQLIEGKQKVTGLPTTFAKSTEAQELIVTLVDDVSHLQLTLNYSVFPQEDVIIRSCQFHNLGDRQVTLLSAASAQVDLPDADYEMVQFSGSWARERHVVTRKLVPGTQSVDSARVASSHQQNPFFMLKRPNTTEETGSVYGFNLIYSGNFLSRVDVDQFDTARIWLGINPEQFSWQLRPGDHFQTPECVLSYTDSGMNQLSAQLAVFYQKHLVNPQFSEQLRPILINNWEATYFDFTEDRLLQIATKAKSLGIELFVLDDGWFGNRNDETSSLGDWTVNRDKFPNGLEHFSRKIHELGMQFGLWFEPEMVSLDSELYRQHPEWVIKTPNRPMTPGRNQYVLDMSRRDVIDYLVKQIGHILSENQVNYVKWDMNRNVTELHGNELPSDQQAEMAHRYILGVYQLYQRLNRQFPDVLFESCAAGGGRFDLGMMAYAPQAWTSDDTDAIERLKIQSGTSYGYALSMMGNHVSASPNEQTGRKVSLEARGRVAFFGVLGYELDVTALSIDDQVLVKRQIAFYKKHRALFQFGRFYRIRNHDTDEVPSMAWEVVSPDKTSAVAVFFSTSKYPNPKFRRLFFKGLNAQSDYIINGMSAAYSGSQLMNAGITIASENEKSEDNQTIGDLVTRMFVVEAVR